MIDTSINQTYPFYSCIQKSVSILFIDDDQNQLEFYDDIFGSYPLYSVLKSSSAECARKIIDSNKPVHLCILDLGISDINNDEFYLLRKYSKKIPFIIMSGSADIERAFEASKLGAAGMIAKPPDIFSPKLWNTISEIFLNKTILPDLSESVNPLLKECCSIIKNRLPESVSDWANLLCITDAYLRKLWSDCFSFSPKHVLFLYSLYKKAFDYYNAVLLTHIGEKSTTQIVNPDVIEHRRTMNYYLQNKEMLDAIRDKNWSFKSN